MKILAVTHGEMIQVMLTISEVLENKVPHDLSLIVSDSAEYFGLSGKESKAKRLANCRVLREWEMFDKSRDRSFSSDTLLSLECDLGEPLLRTALADRRLCNGRRCMDIQDYGATLAGERLNQVIVHAYAEVERFLDEEAPDMVLSFGLDCYCDYVAWKLCSKKELPFLVLQSNEQLGNVMAQSEFGQWPAAIWKAFNATSRLLEAGDMKLECIEAAHTYVERVEQCAQEICVEKRKTGTVAVIKRILKSVWSELVYGLDPAIENDLQRGAYFQKAWRQLVLRPWRRSYQERRLEPYLVDPEAPGSGKRRIYFPLRYEPCVLAPAESGNWRNQIEVIRSLAMAAPADAEILVKDHPEMHGYRSSAYYRKLIEIPRVRLLDASVNTSQAIRLCHACVMITGSSGLEAAILGKPVLLLGDAPYSALGAPHFYKFDPAAGLTVALQTILEPDVAEMIRQEGEEKFTRLLSIVYENSCRIDLKQVFLGKNGPETANRFSEQMQRRKQIEAFVDYLAGCFPAVSQEDKASEQAA